MKKTAFVKCAAFLIALIMCFSMGLTSAFAAGDTPASDTGVPALPTQAAQASQTTHDPTADSVSVTDQFKAQVIVLVNAEREKAGVAALKEMDSLNKMADIRAHESAVSFSHTRPDGTRCFTIFAENSMKYRAVGENLAYGYNTPEAVVNAWMNSESHKRNILDPDFKFIGIGSFENGTFYCSELFYTPRTSK